MSRNELIPFYSCIRFLWLLQQIIIHLATLKTAEMYPFTALEERTPKSVSLGKNQGVSPCCVPSRGSRGESTSCLFQFLAAAGIPWLVDASRQSLPLWPHNLLLFYLISLCLILRRTFETALGPT